MILVLLPVLKTLTMGVVMESAAGQPFSAEHICP